ncbi:MAG: hypothetical protein ACXAC7_22530 [Candidatus Hodarchaeales archaeon]|jgi:hypothetical protein
MRLLNKLNIVFFILLFTINVNSIQGQQWTSFQGYEVKSFTQAKSESVYTIGSTNMTTWMNIQDLNITINECATSDIIETTIFITIETMSSTRKVYIQTMENTTVADQFTFDNMMQGTERFTETFTWTTLTQPQIDGPREFSTQIKVDSGSLSYKVSSRWINLRQWVEDTSNLNEFNNIPIIITLCMGLIIISMIYTNKKKK